MSDERLNLPSASSAWFWSCPGSWQLSRSLPSQGETTDPEAERGSRIHQALELGDPAGLDEDELEDYGKGLKFANQLSSEWQQSIGINYYDGKGLREQRLWLFDEQLKPVASGKLDLFHLAEPYALIIDFKSGSAAHVPAAARSSQLRLQAVLLWQEHPSLIRIRVAYARTQSKVGASDWCDYTRRDLEYAYALTMAHLWESKQPDAPRRAGPWCRYCPCRGDCPEAGAMTLLPSVKASPLELVYRMSIPDLIAIWEKNAIIDEVQEAVSNRLKGLSDSELAAHGLERTKGKKLDPITDPKGGAEILTGAGLSSDAIWAAMELSKPKLVDGVRAEKGMGKEQAAKWLDTQLDPVIERKLSAPSLRRIK